MGRKAKEKADVVKRVEGVLNQVADAQPCISLTLQMLMPRSKFDLPKNALQLHNAGTLRAAIEEATRWKPDAERKSTVAASFVCAQCSVALGLAEKICVMNARPYCRRCSKRFLASVEAWLYS